MYIHWHEGLFLLPQHLQVFQHSIRSAQGEERRLSWAYPYGIVEMQLSVSDLKNRRLRFERLHVVLPGGTVVDYPTHATLPVIDFKDALDAFGNLEISLGVPLWLASRSNTANPDDPAENAAKIRYRLYESEIADENTGANPMPLMMRKLNAKLLIGGEDRTDLETIPLLQIVRGTAEGLGEPRQDREFTGPCLVLAASPLLWELVTEIRSEIQSCRAELNIQLTRGGFNMEMLRGSQIGQLMRLRALTRTMGRLDALLSVPTVTPFSIYLELLDLLNELASLHPDQEEAGAAPYDHDAPWPVFKTLHLRIARYLRGQVSAGFLRVDFQAEDGMLAARLEENHITEPSAYFLGIQTREDPVELAHFVENEDQFKLMPASMAARAVRGILLKEERVAPMELPALAGLYFFRLRQSECGEMWKRICEERKMIVRWTGKDDADYQATLFMTLPANL